MRTTLVAAGYLLENGDEEKGFQKDQVSVVVVMVEVEEVMEAGAVAVVVAGDSLSMHCGLLLSKVASTNTRRKPWTMSLAVHGQATASGRLYPPRPSPQLGQLFLNSGTSGARPEIESLLGPYVAENKSNLMESRHCSGK